MGAVDAVFLVERRRRRGTCWGWEGRCYQNPFSSATMGAAHPSGVISGSLWCPHTCLDSCPDAVEASWGHCPLLLQLLSCLAAQSLSSPQTPRNCRMPSKTAHWKGKHRAMMCSSDILLLPHHNADGYLHPSTETKGSQWFPLACKIDVTSPVWPKAEVEFQDTCPSAVVRIAR